jgi:hypothetical protein
MDDLSTKCVCGYEFDTLPAHERLFDLSNAEMPSSSFIIKDTPISFEIILPSKRKGLIFVLLGLCIIVWGIVEILAIRSFIKIGIFTSFTDSEMLLLSFIVVMTIVGAIIIYVCLWNHIGKEHIIVTHSTLTVKKDIFGYGRKRIYDLNRVTHLCMRDEGGEDPLSVNLWGGSIMFDYDSETFHFGLSLNEAEAQYIVNQLYKLNRFRAG